MRVRTGTVTVIVLACCLAALAAVLLGQLRGEFQAIGQQDEPEANATTGLYFALNDMDAQAANVLLVGGNAAAERQLGLVLDQMGQFEALAADALLASQQAHAAAGRTPAAVIDYYQQATDLMQTGILPAVASLASVSAARLDTAYQGGKTVTGSGIAAVAVLGVLLAAALLALQLYLTGRFQRLMNPALAAATALTIVFDPGRAAQYQQAFLSKSQQIVNVGPVDYAGYQAALDACVEAYRRDNADVRFGGYLGAEFRNITFPGERQAAVAALLAFQRYEQDDRTLRALGKSNLAAAVAYDIGTSPGQSDGAFTQYDAALSSVIAINSTAFTAAVKDGGNDATDWDQVFAALAVAFLAVLTVAGVRPRLTEYR